ncbi:glycosyltransferase family 2 protein [Sessilibacter corallicola]|uniref:glycosyltransferase family 2 protein n=1 Tax=Sessilibacter corallicola TaxID=2904075 RepID=UPI002572C16B|nr:glycosyltransferase [Sessilibacter corallicola]
MLVSIVIRTLNEEKYLGELLRSIKNQVCPGFDIEIVLVDSGSDDNTVSIAKSFGCKIVNIRKSEFSFGRSLNIGCEAASGEYLAIISGHCVPTDEFWLANLCKPFNESNIGYVYGRQVGYSSSFFSEKRIFSKYFPQHDAVPQSGFFCNNANSVIRRDVWKEFLFDEDLTGLEDMYLAKAIVGEGWKVAYVSSACVYHIHEESWSQIERRFEREAIALQEIMPQIRISMVDFLRYLIASIVHDLSCALRSGVLFNNLIPILKYRFYQYRGSFKGNRSNKKLTALQKEEYFYPKRSARFDEEKDSGTFANEG